MEGQGLDPHLPRTVSKAEGEKGGVRPLRVTTGHVGSARGKLSLDGPSCARREQGRHPWKSL